MVMHVSTANISKMITDNPAIVPSHMMSHGQVLFFVNSAFGTVSSQIVWPS